MPTILAHARHSRNNRLTRVSLLATAAGGRGGSRAMSRPRSPSYLEPGTDWSPNTRCSARASVRAFYRWAQQTGRREDNPTDALLTIAATPGRPRPCPESALLTAVRAAGDRERLMLALGACAGLRRAEIATCRGDALSAGRVGELVSELLPNPWTTHTLRHRFASAQTATFAQFKSYLDMSQ